jgi:hypothetical protein
MLCACDNSPFAPHDCGAGGSGTERWSRRSDVYHKFNGQQRGQLSAFPLFRDRLRKSPSRRPVRPTGEIITAAHRLTYVKITAAGIKLRHVYSAWIDANWGSETMEKLILYLVLLLLIWVWVLIYMALPGLQGLIVIITIITFSLSGCCGRKAREGR